MLILIMKHHRTILIISLIIAVLLPLSGTNFVAAEEPDREEMKMIDDKATRLIEELEDEHDPEKAEKIKRSLTNFWQF